MHVRTYHESEGADLVCVCDVNADRAKAIAAKEMLPREFYDSLFKFAFVRNPWDLQVSSSHHIRRERPQFMGGHDDFESFLRWKLDPPRPYQFRLDTSIERQSDYLIDLDGNLIWLCGPHPRVYFFSNGIRLCQNFSITA